MSVRRNHYKVYIDSRKRTSGTDSNFSYVVQFPADKKFTHVTCLDCLIPKSYYLVQAGYNTFQLQEGATIVTVDVPIGCYTLVSWMNQLTSLLTANSPNSYTYTVTYPGLN